jgi:hypothetical protein
MSQGSENFNVFDPTGMVKSMRDASLDSWAKMMVQLVNTDSYAEASGRMLDAWLTSSGPFRKALDSSIKHSLANLNLPSRDEVTRIAERLTNIEVRLDDLDAKLDEFLRAANKNAS